jgi:hypothetical protein
MTATNVFFSTNAPGNMSVAYAANNAGTSGALNQGNSDTAADYLSLRVQVYTTGTTSTNITKRDIINFLQQCERWVVDQTGLAATPGGANGQGLDYTLKINSITGPIP